MQTATARFPLPAPAFEFAGFSWPRYVATLPTGSLSKRLERARSRCAGPYYHAPRPVTGQHPGRGFYHESDGAPGLRWTWCDEAEGVRIRHTGWFTDEHGDGDTIRGLVFRLPKGRGFLAGWSMGEGMASEVDGTIYDDETDAAYAADFMAENAAELQREYESEERERLECEEEAA